MFSTALVLYPLQARRRQLGAAHTADHFSPPPSVQVSSRLGSPGVIFMRRTLCFVLLACVSLSAATVARGQGLPQPSPSSATTPGASHDAAQSSEAQNRIRVNSDLVVLPVTVKDQLGELVADLQQSDFRIFDGQVEQSVDLFTVEAFPLSLVVLIDDDLKSKDAAQMSPSLRAILGGISDNDEALICRFDLSFYPGDAFSSDFDKLWADLKSAQEHAAPSTAGPVPFVTPPSTHAAGVGEPKGDAAPVQGGHRPSKALDDAIFSAAELLHDRGTAHRKIILVVSDGANGADFNHHSYNDAAELLLRDNISVYSLAVGNTISRERKFARLIRYADDTGGDIYYASTSAAMERLYSQITEQARHEYTLAYIPRNTSQTTPYHKVEVRVARPGVSVKTRQGYYVTLPPSSAPSSGGSSAHNR
jgi:Ca-activated chloride channel family protein